MTPDEIYDTYVDFDGSLKLDLNIFNNIQYAC